MKRIIIVINKNWEADAAFAALFNPDFKSDLPAAVQNFWKTLTPAGLDYPHTRDQGIPKPAVTFTAGELSLEIWCLNNIMTPRPAGADSYYYSYSGQKAKDMGKIVAYSADPILLVTAFGTAGVSSELSKNGSVMVGARVFPYNAGKAPAPWNYDSKDFGTLVDSAVSPYLFDQINIGLGTIGMKYYFDTSVLTPPQSPSTTFQVIADKELIAVGDMNTSSYVDFGTNDPAAVAQCTAYLKNNGQADLHYYSVETTHGIIRTEILCDNFLFISCITDRYKYFDNEVTPKVHAQNFTAAFNGGLFLNWFIPFCLNNCSADLN